MMRRIWFILGLVLLLGMSVFGFRFLTADKVVDLNPTRPATSTSDAMSELNGELRISLPVTISFGELTRLANLAPTIQSGTVNDPVTLKNVVDDRLQWEIKRSAISVRHQDDGLELATSLSGMAKTSGTAKIGGGLGSLLGSLNVKGVPFSQSTEVRANVTIIARPDIRATWTLAPNLDARVQIERADLPIAKLGSVNLRPVLQPVLDRAVAASLEQLHHRLSDPALIKGSLAPIWREACKAFPVETDGTRFWVIIKPTGIGAGRPLVSDVGVTLAASIETEVSLIAVQEAPDIGSCPSFPEKLTILNAADAGQADINLPVIVDWDWLESQFETLLSDPIVEDFGTLTLTDPVVAAFGRELLIGVHLDLQSSKALVPDVRGQVWLKASPVLDKSAGLFRIQNVALTTESATALGSVASWTADKVLATFLNREISIDLADLEARVIAQANAQVEGLAKALGDRTRITADLNSFKVSQFAIAPTGLAIFLEAEGRLAVEDLKLDFLE